VHKKSQINTTCWDFSRIFIAKRINPFLDSNFPKSYLLPIRGYSWHKNEIKSDEGISTIFPHSPIINQDTKDISQDIRIDMPTGPITRAQARQLQQQVNLILNEYNNLFSENFILPNSSILFILRYIDDRVIRIYFSPLGFLIASKKGPACQLWAAPRWVGCNIFRQVN
jgi:hypothetical protein